MIRIYFRKRGSQEQWQFATARNEAEAARIRAGLIAEGFEVN